MRVNVYTEELLSDPSNDAPKVAEIVTAEYVSSRMGLPMKNYGIRIYLESSPKLHYVPPRDDDRSAVTFWCGSKDKNVLDFLDMIRDQANQTREQVAKAEGAEALRRSGGRVEIVFRKRRRRRRA